ncbi:MAG: hypothetical protein P4L33_08740 [Capsulimonadaceae bacterium]|nr:hypothetical protein [Capsulimonadaceae bacterium]
MTTAHSIAPDDSSSSSAPRAWQPVDWLILLAVLFFAALLAANILAACYSRFVADDFILAVGARRRGPIVGAFWGYCHWTGRYFAGLLSLTVCSLTRDGRPGWYPALILLTWIACCFAAARARFGVLMSLLLATGVPAVTLLISPNVFESAYWVTGLSCYMGTVLGLSAFACFLLRLATPTGMIACCLLPIAIAGTTEPGALITPVIVLCALAAGSIRVRPAVPVLISCALSIALVAFAPGNHVRHGAAGVHPSLFDAALHGLFDMQLFLSNAATLAHPARTYTDILHWSGSGWALIALGALVMLASTLPSSVAISSRVTLAGLVCGQFAMWAPFFVCRYGTGRPAPSRSMIIADFALAVMAAIVGLYVGEYARKWSKAVVLMLASGAIVALAFAGPSVGANMARPRAMSQFATNWDRFDRRIRQGGPIDHIIVNPGDDGTEAVAWQLGAAQAYYGHR